MSLYPDFIPVIIVGAGPTGLTCANLLGAYGVDCIVLDREPGPMDIPRAIVLDDEGSRTLQTFGVHRTYVRNAIAAQGSRYYDDGGTSFAETGAGSAIYGFPMRQYIHQPALETALRDALEAQTPGRLYYASEVTGISQDEAGLTVGVQGPDGATHRISTRWVLACDGGRSPIRESLKIGMSGNTYKQDWIVLDMTDDPDGEPVSRFYCSNHRPTVSVPAPDGGRRYEFMLLEGETREQMLAPETLAELLRPYREYDEAKTLRKTVYTFHARIAERYRHLRILLLGDAAHLTPPFAGQGMNAGLRDAFNVAWKIAAVENGQARQQILDSYETERKRPAWDMIQLAVTMGKFVMPVEQRDIDFRQRLLENLEPFPAVRDFLIQMRFKPRPRHDDGLYLDRDDQPFEASLVGEMIPQPGLGEGMEVLLDELLGPGFALLAQDEAGREAMDRITGERYLGLPLGRVFLPLPCAARPGDPVATDPVVARPLRTHRDHVMLIRPDRYCAASFAPAALRDGLDRYARTLTA